MVLAYFGAKEMRCDLLLTAAALLLHGGDGRSGPSILVHTSSDVSHGTVSIYVKFTSRDCGFDGTTLYYIAQLYVRLYPSCTPHSWPMGLEDRTTARGATAPRSIEGLPVTWMSSPTKLAGNSGSKGMILSRYSICWVVSLMLRDWMLSFRCWILRPPTMGKTLGVCVARVLARRSFTAMPQRCGRG